MGMKFKVDGVVQDEVNQTDGTEIPLNNSEMTERMWSLINENTGLQQQVTLLKSQLESIKRIVAE